MLLISLFFLYTYYSYIHIYIVIHTCLHALSCIHSQTYIHAYTYIHINSYIHTCNIHRFNYLHLSLTHSLAPKNRWLNKADPTQAVGYELFGKKINPIATPEPSRNKFTLELTSPAFIDGITSITPTHTGGTAGTAQSSGIDDDNTVSANSNNAVSTNRLARALEATDDVILCGLSDNECIDDDDDDDDDDKQLFKSIIADELQSNEEGDDVDYSRALDDEEVSSAAEPDLEKTQSSLEGLEKSAYDLEHWLEDMVSE